MRITTGKNSSPRKLLHKFTAFNEPHWTSLKEALAQNLPSYVR